MSTDSTKCEKSYVRFSRKRANKCTQFLKPRFGGDVTKGPDALSQVSDDTTGTTSQS